MAHAALEYAEQHGLAVLPLHTTSDGVCTCPKGPACTHPAKHPRIRNWVRAASRDAKTIAGWWGRWPEANLGILTGAASGIVALDIDPRNGGDETLGDLERRHGKLPGTPTALTGGGGRHVLLEHPGGSIASTANVLGPGVDVRADGGLIVAAPSVHQSGREYIWHPEFGLDAVGVAPMPAWLVERLAGARRVLGGGASAARPRPWFRWEAVLDGVEEGGRHVGIFLMASSLRGPATSQSVVETLALCAAGRCRPPFPPDEALAIVRDVYRRYPTNGERPLGMSPERIDILAVLWTAARPMQPATVARILGKSRGAVKKLMAGMRADGQLDRVAGGYVPRIPTASGPGLPPMPGGGAADDDWEEV